MSQTPHGPITDELLSAYIDGAVTTEEKRRIEAAMAVDPDIAWQVETLRQTVQLLHDLPRVPLPRSFTLSEAQVADVLAQRRSTALASLAMGPSVARPADSSAQPATLWQRMSGFFRVGNPVWRNAAAVAAVLFLILLVGDPTRLSPLQSRAPISESPSVESIALEAPAAAQPQEAPAAIEAPPVEVQAAPPLENMEAAPAAEPATEAVPAPQMQAIPEARSLESEAPRESSAGPAAAAAEAEAVTQEEAVPAAEADTAPVSAAALPTLSGEAVAPEKAEMAEPAAQAAETAAPIPSQVQGEGTQQQVTPVTEIEPEAIAEEAAAGPAQEEPLPIEVAPRAANPETQAEPSGAQTNERQPLAVEQPAQPQNRWATLVAIWVIARWVLLGLALVFAGLWWQSRRTASAG